VGATLNLASTQFYAGDESNQNRPLPGFHVLKVHATYQIAPRLQAFGSIDNLLNARYATYGILADPTGVGAPGIPADGVTNGPGVDNRFQSPAPPFAVFAGIRLTF
jgi:iron complex outermembrane receptor protein